MNELICIVCMLISLTCVGIMLYTRYEVGIITVQLVDRYNKFVDEVKRAMRKDAKNGTNEPR